MLPDGAARGIAAWLASLGRRNKGGQSQLCWFAKSWRRRPVWSEAYGLTVAEAQRADALRRDYSAHDDGNADDT